MIDGQTYNAFCICKYGKTFKKSVLIYLPQGHIWSLQIIINFTGQLNITVLQTDDAYSNVIIVQKHPKMMTAQDEVYHVVCDKKRLQVSVSRNFYSLVQTIYSSRRRYLTLKIFLTATFIKLIIKFMGYGDEKYREANTVKTSIWY